MYVYNVTYYSVFIDLVFSLRDCVDYTGPGYRIEKRIYRQTV